MQYVIFDLEWNCTHIGKDAFLNEIIEIGAVKLDSQLNEIGRFSELICPKKGKRLNKYVRGLTHIDENELKSADDLHNVLKRFKTFCKGDTLFMSWSDTDLHVFLENYRFFYHTNRIGFIKKYADLQKYVMRKLEIGAGSQPSLSAVAERLEIPDDTVSYHRACDDSAVCGEILRRTFNQSDLKNYICVMDDEYYNRLNFKAYYISSMDDPNFDINDFGRECPDCKIKLNPTGKIKFYNGSFSRKYECQNCKKRYKLFVKIRKTYDNAIKKIRFVEIKEKKSEDERKD